jgi:hypothetical protein
LWTHAGDDEGTFELDRATGTGAFSPRATVPGNTMTFTDAFVEERTTYRYRLRAIVDEAASEWVSTTITTPSRPVFVDASAAGFTLVRGVAEAGAVADARANDGLTQVLREHGDGGAEGLDAQWRFDVASSVPSSVIADVWSSSGSGAFSFAWSSDATTWRPLFTATRRADGGAIHAVRLPEGTIGTVYLRASDVDGSASGSLRRLFIDHLIVRSYNDLAAARPAAPRSATVQANVMGGTTVSWTDVSTNELAFRVERAAEGGAWTWIGATGPNRASLFDESVAALVNYRYRVTAYNGAGDSGAATTGWVRALPIIRLPGG